MGQLHVARPPSRMTDTREARPSSHCSHGGGGPGTRRHQRFLGGGSDTQVSGPPQARHVDEYPLGVRSVRG